MLGVGSKAPEFQLSDQDGNTVNITDFKGKKVLLWFFPKASTPGIAPKPIAITNIIAIINSGIALKNITMVLQMIYIK